MIPTNQIHYKFEKLWGKDYKRKDLHGVCRSILRAMGRSDRNPVEEVKKQWPQVAKFLEDWNGAAEEKHHGIQITKEQKLIFAGKVCPYCKNKSEYLKDSTKLYGKDYGPVYICWDCRAWVGCHRPEPTKALGRLATKELRELKSAAHAAFDPIYKSNLKSRHEAYAWLSKQLGIPIKYTHIGMFGVETCKKVILLCNKEME